jgi:glycosyltransferase involved in cell wall biosynthesis
LNVKVLFVDHNAISSSGRVLYRELSSFPEVEVTVLAPRFWRDDFGEIRFEAEAGSLTVLSSRTFFTARSHRALYLSLRNCLQELKPEIFYVNSEPEGYLAWQAVMLRERLSLRTKIVFDSWRNIDYQGGRFPYKFPSLNAAAERVVLAKADHCIAHNETAKLIFKSKGFEKTTVIPPWVDLAVFKKKNADAVRNSLGLRGFTIGYVGRFTPLKGVDLLLRAAKELPFEYRILLVGDGPAKSQWMKLAEELRVKDRIVRVGGVRHDEVPAYLNAIDVLVLPSRTGTSWKEQFGRILIEAMACEVPVMGSSSGEIPNVIGEAGVVFREGDVDGLRRSLVELHADPSKRLELAAKGLERVKEQYAVPVVARQYYDLFTSLSTGPKL